MYVFDHADDVLQTLNGVATTHLLRNVEAFVVTKVCGCMTNSKEVVHYVFMY